MPDYHPDKLVLLARQLLPTEPSLAEEIELSAENPSAYVSVFQERLSSRGIDRAVADLSLLALIDGLAARKHLIEIDWKEAPEDVTWNIDQLQNAPKDKDRWAWVDVKYWNDFPMDKFLGAIADHVMTDRGLVLASLDANTDSYPLIVIGREQFPACGQLYRESGYGDLINWADI